MAYRDFRPSIATMSKRASSALGGSSRGSRISTGCGPGTRDVEFDIFILRNEQEYPAWWTRKRLLRNFYTLSEDSYWNSFICLLSLMGVVWVAVALHQLVFIVLDIIYNVCYAVHVFGISYNLVTHLDTTALTVWKAFAFLVDMATFSHYVSNNNDFKFLCYYLRLHRPFTYLWAMNGKNLRGSVLGTALKFSYICIVMRVSWALVWLNVQWIEKANQESVSNNSNTKETGSKLISGELAQVPLKLSSDEDEETLAAQFLTAVYLVDKMFIPIGPSIPAANDIERIICMCIMLSGCLIVTAFAVASITLVISMYMRPEESFRARYRLIIKEMKDSRIQQSQRDRVESFYKMYWHKQRAVSATQLMPTFPPTLPATVYTEIYFEATQKSRTLRDLSYQFLSELSKKMQTVHYIPGDAIMKRLSTKTAYVYITYGDIEMVTAEDDSTAILRMTRGTGLSACAVCAPAGFGRAHLEVRAASFCTAHILSGKDLWRVVIKHGITEEESELILGAYNDHLEKVKYHHRSKGEEDVRHKSSILHFKHCLMALKEAKDADGNHLLARTDIFLEIAKSYVMRNRSDATLTDESDAICLRPTFPYILQPNSSLQMAWNIFVAILIGAVCFIHPYYLVFKQDVPLNFRFFDTFVTGVFLLDLIVFLSTGANVEEGVPITFTQTSSQQMRSYWFVLDVLATAPIFELISTGHFSGINKILRLPKVFKVLKLLEDKCVYRGHVLRFCSYTLLMIFACYLTAALQQGYMCYQFGYCSVTNFTHRPFWEKKPLDDETIEHRITYSLFWSISMINFTAHKETWGAENPVNVVFTLMLLEACIAMRVFMDAVYSATILVTTALREDYDASISVVKNFMIRNQVDPILRRRFISYLQLCWYTDRAYSMTNKRSIFFDLPPHVYQDIVATQRNKYILCIPFMKYVNKENLKDISARARLFYASANEVLINTGDINNEMYVIKRGICEIISPDTRKVIGLLKAKSHFGVLVCLLRLPAFYTIRAVTNVQLFCISRKNLHQVFSDPHIRDAMEYSKTTTEYQRLLKRRSPFISYKPPDPIPNIQEFPLPRKHEADSDFLNPFYSLGFLSILRYIFPRFTIRPDGAYLLRYEWFRSVCAFSSAMVFPSYTYMAVQWPQLYFIALMLDLSAYCDIVHRMLVGFYNENGILVYHPSSTAAYYMKSAFFTDLFGCFPLENLDASQIEVGKKNRFCVTRMKQFLMLNRLIQLYRVPGALKILGSVIERRDILFVLRAIPFFMVLLNVMTSVMVLYSACICTNPETGVWQIEPNLDPGGSWIDVFKGQFRFDLKENPFNLHLATYFWMVFETSTTGYNTLQPTNMTQIRIVFIGSLMATMMLTYFAVRIISIRANVNKDLAEFQEHMKDMVYYMKRELLKSDLQKAVLDYYEYTWDKMGGVDYRNMFKLCDQINLRTDAILHIYGPTFAKCPILTNKDISFLRIIGRAVHSAYFMRGMTIIESNDVISDMYFVDYGGVDAREVLAEISTSHKLPRGSVFGNLDGTTTTRCPTTFVATSKAHLLMINSQVFHNIIKDFPAVQKLFKKFHPDNDRRSFIMGNVADSYHMAQVRAISSGPVVVTGRKGLIKYLYFKDNYMHLYLIFVCLVCVFADVYNAGYQNNSVPMLILLYSFDLAFIMKIMHQYTLPLIVDVENIRRILMPLRKAYFKGEFRYDLMSCLPFEVFCFVEDEDVDFRWMLFSWLRLNRIFRTVTVHKCLKRHQERITINLTLTTIVGAFIWFSLFVHITSCLWFFIGSLEDKSTPQSSWIWKDDGTSWCDNMYICSIYFVLTTFTQNGVGDIMPKKKSEVVFVSLMMILCTMIYLICVGEFSNVIQYQSFRNFTFYSQYLELQDFLRNNRVSKNLVDVVNQYSLHLWRESRGKQVPHFLSTAPQALRLQIMSAAYLHHLNRHHVFENCEPAFLRQLVGCLQILTYNEDMYVVKSSEITDAMYLIHKGKIQEIADSTRKVPRIYPAGSYFGVSQGLIHDLPYTHSYRTLSKSQVLTLRLDDWFYLLQHYPLSREAISHHIKYDDDDGQDGGWSKPKPSKPTRSTLAPKSIVTELEDKGSQSAHPPPEGGPSQPAKKFTIPLGPELKKDDDAPVQLQPGLYPTGHKPRKQAADQKLADDTKQQPAKVTRLPPLSKSSISLQPREHKDAAKMETTTHATKQMMKITDKSGYSKQAPSKDNLLQKATDIYLKELEKTQEPENEQNLNKYDEQNQRSTENLLLKKANSVKLKELDKTQEPDNVQNLKKDEEQNQRSSENLLLHRATSLYSRVNKAEEPENEQNLKKEDQNQRSGEDLLLQKSTSFNLKELYTAKKPENGQFLKKDDEQNQISSEGLFLQKSTSTNLKLLDKSQEPVLLRNATSMNLNMLDQTQESKNIPNLKKDEDQNQRSSEGLLLQKASSIEKATPIHLKLLDKSQEPAILPNASPMNLDVLSRTQEPEDVLNLKKDEGRNRTSSEGFLFQRDTSTNFKEFYTTQEPENDQFLTKDEEQNQKSSEGLVLSKSTSINLKESDKTQEPENNKNLKIDDKQNRAEEIDQTKKVEKGMLNELLTNVHESYSIDSLRKEEDSEEHMLTVDMTDSQATKNQEDTTAAQDYNSTVLGAYSASGGELPASISKHKKEKEGNVERPEKVARFGDDYLKKKSRTSVHKKPWHTKSKKRNEDEASQSQSKRIRVRYEEDKKKPGNEQSLSADHRSRINLDSDTTLKRQDADESRDVSNTSLANQDSEDLYPKVKKRKGKR